MKEVFQCADMNKTILKKRVFRVTPYSMIR